MLKRTISLLIAAVMSITLFTGCSLFVYDAERDYKQVVASVASVEITDETSSDNFRTEKHDIYKYELVNALNTTGASLINSGYYTTADAIDYLMNQLITRKIVLNEADARIYFGHMVWGQYEENQVLEGIYDAIDNELATIKQDILSQHGSDSASSGDAATTDSSSATYPVPEDETEGYYDYWSRTELLNEVIKRTVGETKYNEVASMTESALRTALEALDAELGDTATGRYNKFDKDELIVEYMTRTDSSASKIAEYTNRKLRAMLEKIDLENVKPFEPDEMRYPGLYGDENKRSLEIEAMRRFMASLSNTVKNDYRITEEQRKTFRAELKDLNAVGSSSGLPYIYPLLGKTELMEYVVGQVYRESIKISLLQSYLTDDVDVTEDEVLEEYNNMLTEQMDKYADGTIFANDITEGNERLLLYYPNGNYYYVKHILVPFSDVQTAQLKAFKEGNGALQGSDAIAQFKANLGKNVKGYEHRDGENYGELISIDDIYADVVSSMERVKGSKRESDREFDRLIYKYNTDPGIFGKELGYVVNSVFSGDTKYDTKYMQEFSEAADALFRAGKECAISEPVATDYGVHILYLSKVIPTNGTTLKITDYIGYGEHTTVYEHIEDELLASKVNNKFSRWQDDRINYYRIAKDENGKDYVTINRGAYKDLY